MWLLVCSGQLLGHFGLLQIAKSICDPEIWLWTFWSTSMRFILLFKIHLFILRFFFFFWGRIHVYSRSFYVYEQYLVILALATSLCVYIFIYLYGLFWVYSVYSSKQQVCLLAGMYGSCWLTSQTCCSHMHWHTLTHTQTHIHTATCAPSPTGMTSAARLAGRKDLPKSHTDTCIHISEGRADV